MAKERLIGNDGAIYLVDSAIAELTGDATKTLDVLTGGTAGSGKGKGFYRITSLTDTKTEFWADVEVGDYFYDNGALVLSTGNKAVPICLLNEVSEDTSIKGFEISLTKDKIDVTTLADKVKTYRMGKVDASGTMSGITTIGDYTIQKRFLDILKVSDSGTFTMNRKTNSPLFFVGFLNDEDIEGDTLVAVVGKIEIESGAMGATDGSAQEFSSSFAPSSGDRLQIITIDIPNA